jgi:hypothetical protein
MSYNYYFYDSGISYASPIGPRRSTRETIDLLHITDTYPHIDGPMGLNFMYDTLLTLMNDALTTDDIRKFRTHANELLKIAKLKAQALRPDSLSSLFAPSASSVSKN